MIKNKKPELKNEYNLTMEDEINAINEIADMFFQGKTDEDGNVIVEYTPYYEKIGQINAISKYFIQGIEFEPGEDIYAGQVVGEHTRDRDLNINICKTKKLTNVRAAGSDEKIILPPAIKFSLEEALEYIQEDELVEVTPHHMRIRKILLDPLARKRNSDNED